MCNPGATFVCELLVMELSVSKEPKTLEHSTVTELLCMTNKQIPIRCFSS